MKSKETFMLKKEVNVSIKKKKVNILDNKQCGTFLTKRNAFTNSHTKRPERPQKIAKVYDKIITIVKRSPFKIKVKNT